MRIVFMGTPAFAVPSLLALAEDHEVAAVYSRADSVSGRGKSPRPSAVKQAALGLGLDVRTPSTLRDPHEHAAMRAWTPDIGVVAAYGLILPAEILTIPARGFVNVHGSLLPRWRGAAPVQRAILAGDETTGVSIMRMEEGLDTGPFCEVAATTVAAKTAEELTEELAIMGAETLLRALERIEQGTCVWTPQDDELATYAAKISKDDVALSPDLSEVELLRRIRASNRQAPARIVLGDVALTVLAAEHADESLPPGTARVTGGDLLLGGADGSIKLTAVKPEGRTAMDAAAWVRGARIGGELLWRPAS